jgi:uncharacterized DUF497 family protein
MTLLDVTTFCIYNTVIMKIEWDEEKNAINIRKHGFDFADAWEIFERPMLTRIDDRFDYSEERWVGIGSLRGRIVVIVFTERGEDVIGVISLRKALASERKAYERIFPH